MKFGDSDVLLALRFAPQSDYKACTCKCIDDPRRKAIGPETWNLVSLRLTHE